MNILFRASVEKLLLLGFGLSLGVLLLVAGIAWNIAEPMAPFKSVDQTREVMSALDELRANTDRADYLQLAYFLTQDKEFLLGRDATLATSAQSFQQLFALTLDNAAQQARLRRLQAAIANRTHILLENQSVFDRSGLAYALPLFRSGRESSATLKALMQEAKLAEVSLLEARKASEGFRLKIIVGSVFFLLVVLVPLALRVRRLSHNRLADEQTALAIRETLLKTGALQDAIFKSANFSSIATDAQGVIQIFNVGAERMLGYTAEEVVDKITPAGISDAQELIARALALSHELETTITPGFEALVFKASRGIEDIYELTYIRKDGSRFPAIVSVTALRDEPGNVIGYLLIGTDNTAGKQVEAEQAMLDQRLRDQQFYTRSLIESNIDALMTTDPRGIISDVNQQMEVLTGCTRDELIGAPFKKFFTDPNRAESGITRVLQEGKVTNYELTALARTGVQTVVSYNATTFHDRDRKLQGVFASARDITERKQFERTLEVSNLELEAATSAAERANRAKSDFLSSMSHELRTPLNAILGFTQLLDTGTPAPTPGQKRSVDQILKAGWYLLELINEILDLALIESGRLTLSNESVSLGDVILECRAMIEPQAQKRGIGMLFPRLDLPCYVKADRTRLKQIMINLLSNAIKYNREGGAVVIEMGHGQPGSIRVSVRDTGVGMVTDQLTQLFQPFNRLGKENSTEEGTGIGLVVTKRLVELMGGSIGVDSVPGAGSVFWFELEMGESPPPMGKATVPPALPMGLAKDGIAQRVVLYVEDNPANLELVEQILERRPDLSLLSAADATIGIEFARIYQPEVILMDINMAGISGLDALKILRADPLTAHIPIIAVSANAIPGDVETGLRAGFFNYVTKPIQVSQFMDALDAALAVAKPSTTGHVAEKETP